MGSNSSTSKICIQQLVNRSIGKSSFEIVYGIQPRRITELRHLNQDEFISSREENFATGM
jgi:hypothetical protein